MDRSTLRALLRIAFGKVSSDAPQHWNVMVVPMASNAAPHNIHVSRRMIQVGATAAVGVLLFTVVAWTYSLVHAYGSQRDEVRSLRQDLKGARVEWSREVGAARTELNGVRTEFDSLIETEGKLRAIAGLKPRYHEEEDAMGGRGGRAPEHGLDDTVEALEEEVDDAPTAPLMPDWSHAPVPSLYQEFTAVATSYAEIKKALSAESARLDSTPMIHPVEHPDAWISSGFGYRTDPLSKKRRFHDGMDVVAPRGTDVLAPANGTVSFAGWKQGLGKHIVIKHDFGFKTLYAHCDRLAVQKGETVVRGQTIGYLGSTGRSTGPHLHYEVRRNGKLVNPYKYIIE